MKSYAAEWYRDVLCLSVQQFQEAAHPLEQLVTDVSEYASSKNPSGSGKGTDLSQGLHPLFIRGIPDNAIELTILTSSTTHRTPPGSRPSVRAGNQERSQFFGETILLCSLRSLRMCSQGSFGHLLKIKMLLNGFLQQCPAIDRLHRLCKFLLILVNDFPRLQLTYLS